MLLPMPFDEPVNKATLPVKSNKAVSITRLLLLPMLSCMVLNLFDFGTLSSNPFVRMMVATASRFTLV